MTPFVHACAAAEAIRALNHASIRVGYEWPSDVDAMVGALEVMAQRLPQALMQAATWLHQAHAEEDVTHDEGADPAEEIAQVLVHLDEARTAAAHLALHLGQARAVTTHLAGVLR